MITTKQIISNNSIANFYDELNDFFSDVWGEHIHHGYWKSGAESPLLATQQLVDLIATAAAIKPGQYICDVGCGIGGAARIFAHKYQAHVSALTLSEKQFLMAKSRNHDNTNPSYYFCNWLDNDFPNNSFHKVISIESLDHMTDKQSFFKQAKRVLKKKGQLAFCTWTVAENLQPWHKRLLLQPFCHEGCIPSLGSTSEYIALLVNNGFNLELQQDITAQIKQTWSICIRRVLNRFLTQQNYRHYIFDSNKVHRKFILSLFRIWTAYQTGCLRYNIFVGEVTPSLPHL